MRLVANVCVSVPIRVLCLLAAILVVTATPADAATPELQTVLNNLRFWIAGLLGTLATLFLSIGGLLYLTAAGNTRRIEQAKDAIRSAIVGYVFAGLAPLVVEIIQKITGI